MKANPFDVVLKARNIAGSSSSEDIESQKRYYSLAVRLRKAKGLEPKDQEYLVHVFTALAGGIAPDKIFVSGAKRGKRHMDSYFAHIRRESMKGYIAVLILPRDEEGFGMSLNEAFSQASKDFGFTVSTVRSYWYKSDKALDFIL